MRKEREENDGRIKGRRKRKVKEGRNSTAVQENDNTEEEKYDLMGHTLLRKKRKKPNGKRKKIVSKYVKSAKGILGQDQNDIADIDTN